MIDPELLQKLNQIEQKAEAAAVAAEKARNYLKWTGIITAVLFILPLIGLIFAIPVFVASYTSALNGVGN